MIIHGECLEKLKNLEPNSIDSIVTDSPYGLSFMGKKWDYEVPSVEIWREALRALKPGGHLLSFAGTRTYHRMAVNIEDAGFEIRDQIMWIYGSGFPKSTDVSKRIDKEAGVEREVISKTVTKSGGMGHIMKTNYQQGYRPNDYYTESGNVIERTKPSTDSAKQWQGWGTALKPANEPIVVARKPLEKGLTVAQNVLKYGTGALNIDASRIGTEERENKPRGTAGKTNSMNSLGHVPGSHVQGRWPANVLFDEEAAQVLGEPSRFFYVAKASKRERNAGLEGMPIKRKSHMQTANGAGERSMSEGFPDTFQQNFHPTVKPIKLMEYLIRLVTPPNGTVLDPFMGSGSTGVAAKNLGFEFVGIEREAEYVAIAEKRIG